MAKSVYFYFFFFSISNQFSINLSFLISKIHDLSIPFSSNHFFRTRKRRAKWKFNASIHTFVANESDYFVDTRAQPRCSYASLRKTIHDIDTATCNALNERIRIRHARERSCMPLSVLVDQVFFSTVFLWLFIRSCHAFLIYIDDISKVNLFIYFFFI